MKTMFLALMMSASAFAATQPATVPTTPTATDKVNFEVYTPFSDAVNIAYSLQVLQLEQFKPELFTVTPYFAANKDQTFQENTFWRTAYVAKYERTKLAQWLQCVYFDPETHTCASVVGIDMKPMKKKEKELRKETLANLQKLQDMKSVQRGEIFINGMRYQGPLAWGQLLNEVNTLLPKDKQIANLGKYETTQLWVVGTDNGFGKRDIALEREFFRWIPNLSVQVVAPESKQAMQLLKDAEINAIPAYIFDKSSARNSAIIKLIAAERVTKTKTGYSKFDMKSGTTEIKLAGQETPNTLDLWVMSQCPYGVKAETAFINATAQKLVKEGVKVNLRYIASEQKVNGKTEWKALHGQPELDENIRQIVIQKLWPDKLWKYLEIRNADYNSEDWKPAATQAGVDPVQVEKNLPMGKKLMAKDIADGKALGISGSPSYLWQNRYVLNEPEQYKATIGYVPTEVKATETTPTDKRKPTNDPASKPQATAPADGKCG